MALSSIPTHVSEPIDLHMKMGYAYFSSDGFVEQDEVDRKVELHTFFEVIRKQIGEKEEQD